MILIVVDTGPINYLIQIDHIDLLSTLADKTVLPSSVRAELLNDAAPANIRAWAANPHHSSFTDELIEAALQRDTERCRRQPT
jgi:predicted nucleic acid-binding protein